MCSAVFITGYDVEFAAEHVGYFTAPYDERKKVGNSLVDQAKKTVSVTLPNGVTLDLPGLHRQPGLRDLPQAIPTSSRSPRRRWRRTCHRPARRTGRLATGCPRRCSPPSSTKRRSRAHVDAAFSIPDAETTAFVVTWKGRLIGERYGDGITMTTPLESWSMGKSVTSTIMGTLIEKGVYTLDQPAPIPEWQEQPNDPRAADQDPGHPADVERHPHHLAVGSRLRPEGSVPDHL